MVKVKIGLARTYTYLKKDVKWRAGVYFESKEPLTN